MSYLASDIKSPVFDTGINITTRSAANEYQYIGKYGTFVTEISTVEQIIGKIPNNTNSMVLTVEQAVQLERSLGLVVPLEPTNILSIVDDVANRMPRSPLSGNELFVGPGKGLPTGGSELVIQSIPSAGGQGIRQIIIKIPELGEIKK